MTDDPIELDGVAALKWTALLIGLAVAIAALTKQRSPAFRVPSGRSELMKPEEHSKPRATFGM
jgi:hypothetical protein